MDGQEPIMIFGRVTRGDGGPLTGAALTLCDLAGDQLDRATADEGGHYQLVPPTGGTFLVICSSSTHQPQASLIAVADRPLRHDVSLAGGGATLGGTVGSRRGGTNGSGSGAVDGQADVVLTLTDVRGTVVAVTRSGHDGTYRFPDVAEGTYTITASGYAPVASEIEVGPGHPREVVLTLVPPVVDHGTGPAHAADGARGHGSNGTSDGRRVHHLDGEHTDDTTESPHGDRR